MKILIDSNKAKNYADGRRKANIGCDVCPVCGEARSHAKCVEKGLGAVGIEQEYPKRVIVGGPLNPRIRYIDKYSCWSCGASWESEPFDWNGYEGVLQKM